jgi:hypothetical protein
MVASEKYFDPEKKDLADLILKTQELTEFILKKNDLRLWSFAQDFACGLGRPQDGKDRKKQNIETKVFSRIYLESK